MIADLIKDTTVASRYARALHIVTEKRGETVAVLEQMKGMERVLEPGSKVGSFLASPGLRLMDKREALRRALGPHLLPIVIVFVDLLLRKKRLREFPGAVQEFEALVEKQQGIQRAEVVSATPLEPKEQERLHAALEKRTGATIRLSASVDPRLLGGALVRIGDQVIDRSVRTMLDRVGQQLSEVSV
jgi:F-type H+-transporting ATPase subunit delta